MPAKHRVRLTSDQRRRLQQIVSVGASPARTMRHAHILLLCDEADRGPAWTNDQVADALADALACGTATVARLRRRFGQEGLDACLRVIKGRPGRPPKIDGTAEAHLLALACSQPPEGRERWSLRLLADRFVALGLEAGWLEEPVGHETVRRTLKKTNLKLIATRCASAVGDPAEAEREVRGSNGSRACALPRALRPCATPRVRR